MAARVPLRLGYVRPEGLDEPIGSGKPEVREQGFCKFLGGLLRNPNKWGWREASMRQDRTLALPWDSSVRLGWTRGCVCSEIVTSVVCSKLLHDLSHKTAR